jgi:hypothetical protein
MADRYDRYAEIFENPVSEAEIELGNRALHWLFMENFQASTGYGAVRQHAREAVERGAEPEAGREAGQAISTGVQCQANPLCRDPAPPETPLGVCHVKEARRAGTTIRHCTLAGQIKYCFGRQEQREAGA